jgi:hypothetical protein
MTLAIARYESLFGLHVEEFAGCNSRANTTSYRANDEKRDHDAIDVRPWHHQRTHTCTGLEFSEARCPSLIESP